jgi:molybdate transport system substrate-binding protein
VSPPPPDTLEEDVRAALTKVELGEVDAALVYTTDVTAAGDAVEGIAVPEPSRWSTSTRSPC